jgi:predicted CoA-binding protein
MTAAAPSDEEIRKLLLATKTIAIVGVSANTDRASYHVARYLQMKTQYELFFVNPAADSLQLQNTSPARNAGSGLK